jgi:hypothetical protein
MPCHKFEVQNGNVIFGQDFTLGNQGSVRCHKGYLIENRESKELNLICKHTDGGPRFCSADNVCTQPQCTKGNCLSVL